jgi:hypothetical protein
MRRFRVHYNHQDRLSDTLPSKFTAPKHLTGPGVTCLFWGGAQAPTLQPTYFRPDKASTE